MSNNIENLAIDNSKDITNLRMNRRGRIQYSVDGGKSYSNLNRDEWLNLLITALTKGCTCEDGSTMVPGENGTDGKSAYDIWLELGNEGTKEDFIKSLIGKDGQDGEPGENGKDGSDGKSAYDIWLSLGNTGSEQDFLNSLIGKNGSDGEKGEPGQNGKDGVDGKSAYDIWLELGNEGTKEDFIKSLIGKDGNDGQNGIDGEKGEPGVDGKSTYQIWLSLGNTGSEEEFINSLKGKDGEPGQNGQDGKDGADGQDGYNGKSAYQIWKELGNTGTESDFIKSLTGPKGEAGITEEDFKTELDKYFVHEILTEIYVNGSTGNDSTADGTLSKPYKTIQAAVDSIPKSINLAGYKTEGQGDQIFYKIFISGGTYKEIVNLYNIQSHVQIRSSNGVAIEISGLSIRHCSMVNISDLIITYNSSLFSQYYGNSWNDPTVMVIVNSTVVVGPVSSSTISKPLIINGGGQIASGISINSRTIFGTNQEIVINSCKGAISVNGAGIAYLQGAGITTTSINKTGYGCGCGIIFTSNINNIGTTNLSFWDGGRIYTGTQTSPGKY